MAWRRLQLVTLAVVMATATVTSAQQQPAAATAFPALPSCPPAPLSLSPCIGYVFGAGSGTLSACCSQLKSFLLAQAPCLCAASKLAPSPVGLLLGQAQTIIPNVCDLPNPCDDAASGEGSSPAAEGATSPPSETTTTTPAAETPEAEPASTTAAAAGPDAPPEEPAEDSPAPTGFKLPQLLHAAGATSSRGMSAGSVFVTVFLASVAIMYV